MKTNKKFLTFLLAFTMLFSLIPSVNTYVFAEEDEEITEDDNLFNEEQENDEEEGENTVIGDEEPIVDDESNEDMIESFEEIENSDYVVKTSAWAETEVKEAALMGLIPGELKMKDLTGKITRREFAEVAVRAYDALMGQPSSVSAASPFTDCYDIDVVKAYTLGIVTGTSATTFSPNALLTREQAAVMLTRAYKKAKLQGWSINTDGEFKLQYSAPAAFADDAIISGYAEDSVYFMVANGILSGMGNNNFAPQNDTTREQAIIITLRMVKNFAK